MEQVSEDALQQMIAAFIQYGFKRQLAGAEECLEGCIAIDTVSFDLRVTRLDSSFQHLPIFTLKSIPVGVSKFQPHLERDNRLCYLDKDTVFLDPYQPFRSTLIIIGAVRDLLTKFLSEDSDYRDGEFAGEFDRYWDYQFQSFIFSQKRASNFYFYEKENLSGEISRETVIASDLQAAREWVATRNGCEVSLDQGCPALFIRMNKRLSIPPSTDEWPITSWGAFLKWLLKCDPQAENDLLKTLMEHPSIGKFLTVILYSELSGSIGIHVEFSNSLEPIIRRFSNLSSKRKSVKDRKRSGPSLKKFKTALGRNVSQRRFFRLKAMDVSSDFIIHRNLRTPSLKNKKIALIGAGTVGSYTAELLSKAGAGLGENGQLVIFDGDLLSSANLGRHLLGSEYLNEVKGKALAHYIRSNAQVSKNVSGFSDFRFDDLLKLKGYDLVIDVTGSENFSTLLAHHTHKMRCEAYWTVPILHAWIDAGGKAVRALLDDGTHACYRCLVRLKQGNDDVGALEERFPIYTNDSLDSYNVRVQRCGDSYIPFPAGVSSIAAGLIQLMALSVVDASVSPRFRQIALHPSVRITKNQNIQPKGCPCCQK